MRSVFTTFASSRFVDREAVIERLRACARRLKAEQKGVVTVYLFGSFATGVATPHSDADVVVEVADDDDGGGAEMRQKVWDAAFDAFLKAPVPVDLFVLTSRQMRRDRRDGRGVAAAVSREGMRLE